ncbi:hypothetical protein FXO38_10036 [Capsicum annuum]|nr:hypothetical protein FXO38_10036 [Capsicum annuum]
MTLSPIRPRVFRCYQKQEALKSSKGGHFSGIYRKVQLKPLQWVKVPKSNGEGEEERPTEALMVLKYGGVLTHAGRKQAEELGRYFRNNIYPGEGTGLLRLHSTYRHDLKIYSSDEGRVQLLFLGTFKLKFPRCLGYDVFGPQTIGIKSSSSMITSEPLMGSSNYLAWASSVKLWCKGQGVQDHLMNKASVVDEKGKSSVENAKAKEQWEKVDAQLCSLL